MTPEKNVKGIIPQYLSNMDKNQLINLLQHKTKLLGTANAPGIKFPNYINKLKQEVELIHAELVTKNSN